MNKKAQRGNQAETTLRHNHHVAYTPSKEFASYISATLDLGVISPGNLATEAQWERKDSEREAIAKKIARAPAQSMGELFEKLYLWRVSCFEPSKNGFIYYDDLFPLSAYFDLKEMVDVKYQLPRPQDIELLAHLRTWKEPDNVPD